MSNTIMAGLFRIGRDAEVRYTANSDAVATLSLAYDYGNKKNAEGYLPTQWIDAGLWGKRAESLAEHLKKGTLIYAVLEDVHIETFDKRDGGQGFKLAARVQNVGFTGKPQHSGDHQEGDAPRDQRPQQAQPARQASARAPAGFENMDDDIPF